MALNLIEKKVSCVLHLKSIFLKVCVIISGRSFHADINKKVFMFLSSLVSSNFWMLLKGGEMS